MIQYVLSSARFFNQPKYERSVNAAPMTPQRALYANMTEHWTALPHFELAGSMVLCLSPGSSCVTYNQVSLAQVQLLAA